jgi:hypothetical protein
MTNSPKEAAISKGQRIYEYTDQDGNVFYSFHRFPSVVTHSRTLTLGDRIGTHFDSHLSDLRALRRLIVEEEKEKELGRTGTVARDGGSHGK